MHVEPWQWLLALVAAFLVGLSKTGIVGIGIFAISLFALAFPSRASVGIVLPLLITADFVAVAAYRRHAVWSHLWRLFPWAAAGIVLGYFAMDRIDNRTVQILIGSILIVLVLLQYWRRRPSTVAAFESDRVPHQGWFVALVGIVAGFTTMVANAAGPIMVLYLLAIRLPKMEFLGTGAWYFLTLNLFKVPFSCQLGLITSATLLTDLKLAAFTIGGALLGRHLLHRINQTLFENIALTFTLITAIKLVW